MNSRTIRPLSPTEVEPLNYVWSIGVFTGLDPLHLGPGEAPNPVLNADMVTDIEASFVADPFHLKVGSCYYLFFEAWANRLARGVIAAATSRNAIDWSYSGVVLEEPIHLSYPCVLEHAGEIYMIPETRQSGAVSLYMAESFPGGWRKVADLLQGDFADATVFEHGGRFWLFVHRGLDELRIYFSDDLRGKWWEHPANPVVAGNRRISRPAGRPMEVNGRLIRFAQDAWPHYGSRVRALEVDVLSPLEYRERELPESPILEGQGEGWNALGMHHIDLIRQAETDWLAIVDGFTLSSHQQVKR